jgi:hypothetical protein
MFSVSLTAISPIAIFIRWGGLLRMTKNILKVCCSIIESDRHTASSNAIFQETCSVSSEMEVMKLTPTAFMSQTITETTSLVLDNFKEVEGVQQKLDDAEDNNCLYRCGKLNSFFEYELPY